MPRVFIGREWDWWQDRVLTPLAAALCLALIAIAVCRNGPLPRPVAQGDPVLPSPLAGRLAQISQQFIGTFAHGPLPSLTPVRTVTAHTPQRPPEILYVGAGYCPYCAALRWPLALALMRFGTLSGLREGRSGPAPEFAPDTATLDFSRVAYDSRWVRFRAVEIEDRDHHPLQSLNGETLATVKHYDAAPYSKVPGAIPFLLIGERFIQIGSPVDPERYHGLDWAGVIDALGTPDTRLHKDVLGEADAITRAICATTLGRPVKTCAAYLNAPLPKPSQAHP